jgi:pimeloyl-ACP methyl ester carboxylesterase
MRRIVALIAATLACSHAAAGLCLVGQQTARAGLAAHAGPPGGLAEGATGLRPGDLPLHLQVPAEGGRRRATETLALWWLPHADPAAPTLLYLHGTFRNLFGNLPKINALREAGFAVLAVDYRGWGESAPIVPSEASIHADAGVAWAELLKRQPDARRRVIFGHSMGGAVAVRLASTLQPGARLRRAGAGKHLHPHARRGRRGRLLGPRGGVGHDAGIRFAVAHRRIRAPLLMLHGTADKTVPVELGRRLRDAAPPGVRWVEVPGGSHSRLHEEAAALYRQAMHSLIHKP